MFGFRRGKRPRGIVTTTPQPVPLVRGLIADPLTHLTRGSTYDNRDNLSGVFIQQITRKYEGTRLGRQELHAEVLDDVEGALWRLADIEDARVDEVPKDDGGNPLFSRVVVSVDPATTHGEDSDYTGIAVSAKGLDGDLYVWRAEQVKLSPHGWASRVIDLALDHDADAIVYEANQGGEMVRANIENVWSSRFREAGKWAGLSRVMPRLIAVHASRGKQTRAEPIAALYEQGRVHHVFPRAKADHWPINPLADLEDQMVVFPVASEHDDLVDAVVWGLTELAPATESSGALYQF